MDIISRAEAKERGLKRYYIAEPCRHGHIDERYVRDNTCATCAKIKLKVRYQENPEKQRSRTRQRRIDKPEAVQAARRRWYYSDIQRARGAAKKHYNKLKIEANFDHFMSTINQDEA